MESEVQRRAYALWEAEGRPEGMDQVHWFRAVEEVMEPATKPIKSTRKRTTTARRKAA